MSFPMARSVCHSVWVANKGDWIQMMNVSSTEISWLLWSYVFCFLNFLKWDQIGASANRLSLNPLITSLSLSLSLPPLLDGTFGSTKHDFHRVSTFNWLFRCRKTRQIQISQGPRSSNQSKASSCVEVMAFLGPQEAAEAPPASVTRLKGSHLEGVGPVDTLW